MFIGVEGALIYSLIRFRARKGRVAAQIHGNTRLEIGWTVGAAADPRRPRRRHVRAARRHPEPAGPQIDGDGNPVAASATVRARSTSRPRRTARASMTINVDGQQYVWRYTYPDGTTGSERRLLLQGDGTSRRRRPSSSTIQAKDVIHSWWIPQARRQVRRRPGLHELDVVQDPARRARGGRGPGGLRRPVRRAVRAQPRRHGRQGDRASRLTTTRRRVARREGTADQARRRQARRAPERDPAASRRLSRGAGRVADHHGDSRDPPRPQIIAHEVEPASRAAGSSWLTTTDHKKIGILYMRHRPSSSSSSAASRRC